MTLGLFLSSKERKMSRLVDQVDESLLYEPDLFLQGLIVVRFLKYYTLSNSMIHGTKKHVSNSAANFLLDSWVPSIVVFRNHCSHN